MSRRINSDVGFEANLGYKQNASYGLETLGLGFAIDGPTLEKQTVSRILSARPFYTYDSNSTFSPEPF